MRLLVKAERPVRTVVSLVDVMRGSDFPGCDNWSGPADTCTCETWRPIECQTCRQDVVDGQEYVDVWCWWAAEGSDDLEFESETHHADCWNERGA